MNLLMIMGHKNPGQILRLVQRCKTQNTDIVIHYDKKAPASEYDVMSDSIQRDYGKGGGVYLVEKRLSGELDSRSLVDITVAMIDLGHEIERLENKHYDYFLLLSGQCYPIRPMAEIEDELLQCYPCPLIDCTPYHRRNWLAQKLRKNTMDQCVGRLYQFAVSRKWRIARSFFYRAYHYGKPFLLGIGKDVRQRLRKCGVSPYGGSQWWILPDKAIDFAAEQYHQSPDYVSLLLNEVSTPEEIFFPTLAMLSPISTLVQINPPGQRAQNCRTWAFFEGEGKPFKCHPYIIEEDDFSKLKQDEFWFARKFDSTVDSNILDKIDIEFLHWR